MTPAQFKAWRVSLLLSQKEAAVQLGVTERHVQLMETNKRKITRVIELACVGLWYWAGSQRGTLRWQNEQLSPGFPWAQSWSKTAAQSRRDIRKRQRENARTLGQFEGADSALVQQILSQEPPRIFSQNILSGNAATTTTTIDNRFAPYDLENRERHRLEEEYNYRRQMAVTSPDRWERERNLEEVNRWYGHSLRNLNRQFR